MIDKLKLADNFYIFGILLSNVKDKLKHMVLQSELIIMMHKKSKQNIRFQKHLETLCNFSSLKTVLNLNNFESCSSSSTNLNELWKIISKCIIYH